jgi:drug/metabolite transporter (DMT)-like permease
MRSRAAGFMALSALGFSAMSLMVKLAARELPTGEIVLARAVITLSLSYVLVRRAGVTRSGHQNRWLFVRGGLGFLALALYYLSLVRLPLAEATTLQNTIPVLTTLFAWWLLGERVGGAGAFALACGLGGVLLVARPSGDGDMIGVACALAGAVCSSLAYVTVRKLSRTEHPFVIVFYFPLVAAPLAVPWAASDCRWPSVQGWLLLAGIGAATQVGQVFLTKGLAVERAGRASSMGYLQICFAIVWQLLVFGDPPSVWTLAGATLIVAGTLAVSTRS